MKMMMGIEQEFVFKDISETYLDCENATYQQFQSVVDKFPFFEGDEKFFDCKSLEVSPKRCYVEGFERYDIESTLLETLPKGLEIRTLPHNEIDKIVDEFVNSYNMLMSVAKEFGMYPLLSSVHPYKQSVYFKDPLCEKEHTLRTEKEYKEAIEAMLAHGLQVNISIEGTSREILEDMMEKVNYYAPYVIPFSFSSPFYKGQVFDGLSYRTYHRDAKWKIIHIEKRKGVDVLEFRGFDAVGDAKLLRSLLFLLKGLLLDETLKGRAPFFDTKQLKRSCLQGFEDEDIKQRALIVLEAVKTVLQEEGSTLKYLESLISDNNSYAKRMKALYVKTGDIMKAISNQYNY